MGKVFTDTFESKLIYIIRINQKSHQGLLKIGETTVKTDEPLETLQPNSRILNQAAKKRVNTYTNTAGIQYELLHTELAIRNVKDKKGNIVLKTFKDYDVHAVLTNSLFKKHTFDKATGQEWFKTDLDTALEAIAAVKRNEFNLSGVKKKQAVPIIFRPEQEQAITQTLKQFEKGTRMLWNAKMRFGKTLCALEVVRRSKFKKTLIMTHRPVVDQGWYEEFGKIFLGKSSNYIYGSKKTGTSSSLDSFINSDKNFIYFASIQDLRESSFVGGKYEKNDEVFETVWDCVIVDEAHEGTTTELGDEVISTVIKENLNQTKLLELSGTPFNIIGNYDDNIFTWDYIMEQKQKEDWYENTFGDSNPYLNLPQLKIFTYDLDKKFKYSEIEDKAFNFREFFRVWTGDIGIDKKRIPENQKVGDFVHRDDIWSFLNLLTKKDDETEYPFSTEKYRSLFRHSLWMIPGVKEAKALSKLMKSHPMFGNGTFQIVNVAGDGDKDEESKDALEKVQTAIKNAGTEGYTITLSCGRLTTGVTIPEWTAVFYLAGSFSTSAANYLQTIFRVQSPCNINGKIKTSAYVFDFAPDRTLKMVAESVTISTRAGKTKGSDRNILGEFLNYCPVISIEGSTMKKYSTNRLLQQLKRAYAERVVQNGFDDYNLYNDDLLRLDNIEIEKFQKLKGIIGSTRSSHSAKEIKMNEQGFTEEEYELIERIKRKRKIERTPEEEAKLAEANEKTKQARNARSILRGISIRMPLLIYGVDIDFDEDITMEKLVKEVDDSSWEEFMPKGVTKEIFKDFIKYYDPEVFAVAGRKIRDITKGADELSPTERVKQISQIFSKFKNPDKETVLTPWRVVNMHMGDTLGGYNFYKNDYKEVIREDEEPYLIEHEKVTQDTLSNKDSKILEINSKTGLYPLYLTYSIFKERCKKYEGDKLTREIEEKAWEETLKENIYIICKTPMAKSITNRTLTGYRDLDINASYFDDLNNMMRNKSKQFVDKVSRALS